MSVWGLRGEGVEPFGYSEAFISGLNPQLPLLDHVHEFDTSQGGLCHVERFEPEHRLWTYAGPHHANGASSYAIP